ncbi:folate-sensitive fragile site protein Fra10Ac1 [Helicosporidium sp. ATCC 50920]|nr:folate-sensitive fragile site protein Fra10Ac1 [Helicosporidium sp. ATCC 50920]|eukprot:KDD75556.1 folate-sensitive fragile site protein Fra10Ac1 [Helicosporidium sp. ATCC 50920]
MDSRAIRSLSPRARHEWLLSRLAPSRATSTAGNAPRSDQEAVISSFRFLRAPEDEAALDAWESRLARAYYARLFREYALADLSRARSHAQIGLRWRTGREVAAGTGQFSCGALGCNSTSGLASFELPFQYEEADTRKAALVKARLCTAHAEELLLAKPGSKGTSRAKEAREPSERKEARRSKEGRRRDEKGGVEEEAKGAKVSKRKRGEVREQGRAHAHAKHPAAERSQTEFDEFFAGLLE